MRLLRICLPGLHMRIAVAGSGPLVLLCHGFPESWCVWRQQIFALARAGYQAVAPDMRGYGGTDAPPDPASYTMLSHVGDMVNLIHALGKKSAIIVGHDWGAAVAWHSALLRPDLFKAVVGMSVPYFTPGPVDLLTAWEASGIRSSYIQYFEQPGLAELEFERDTVATIRRISYSLSGDGRGSVIAKAVLPGANFLDATEDPATLPHWLRCSDIEYIAGEFARTGFRGALNWYRGMRRSSQLLAPWYGCHITQPSVFIVGGRDDVLKLPGFGDAVRKQYKTLPNLRGCHVLVGAGHWIQRERSTEVNQLLLDFLAAL